MYQYRAQVVRVVDGDTLDLRVDLGFHVNLNIRARLVGIDTPETFGRKRGSAEWEAGMEAVAFVHTWLMENYVDAKERTILIDSHKGQGKYGRWLVDVIGRDGSSLNKALLDSGNATETNY